MEITSIKWNGRYSDIYDGSGGKVGTKYVANETTVSDHAPYYGYKNRDTCKEIIQENLTTYLIKFYHNEALRIFNPIEVTFKTD